MLLQKTTEKDLQEILSTTAVLRDELSYGSYFVILMLGVYSEDTSELVTPSLFLYLLSEYAL